LSEFFKHMGVNSYHQRHYRHPEHKHFFNYSRGERWIIQYNLDNPLDEVKSAVDKMQLPIDLPVDSHFFVSTWAIAEVIYLVSQRFPQIEWIITMRNIQDTSNSVRRYLWKPDRMDKVDVDFLALTYINIYQFILKQARKMTVPPYFLDFDDMVGNRKSKELLDLFGLEFNEKRQRIAEKVWRTKHNSYGEYKVNKVDIDYLILADELRNNLRKVCRCL